MKITQTELNKMLCNPFYAINFGSGLFGDHEPMISEKEWVRVQKILIEEMGQDKYFKLLLDVLKGNYV